MKKIDKLILTSFIGPFILTFLVVVFILLLQTMLKYFDDFFGKGIDFFVFIEMFFYFALNTAPVALPLAVLLSSLMTFGNLGEHYELIAIKSSGISLIRILAPVFVFVVILSISAFIFNDRVVPKANLSAFSLLWDIRQKKPTLQFIQGAFYNGLDGYSIKVDKKFPENENLLKGLTIYDHTDNMGNTKVIVADSAIMQTLNEGRNLSIQMFDGNMFFEGENQRQGDNEGFTRSKFHKMTSMFNLNTFLLNRSRKEMFAGNKQMKNVRELGKDADSIRKMNVDVIKELSATINPYFSYHNTPKLDTFKVKKIEIDSFREAKKFQSADTEQILSMALNNARTIKSLMGGYSERFTRNEVEASSFDIERNSKFTQSFACLVMFLIGAPLGAIIKKGGLGLPVLISIAFFITFYVLTIISQKWAKGGLVEVIYASWAPNAILLPMGLFFLKQARNDARLFEADAYSVMWNNFIAKFKKKKQLFN